MAWRTFGTLFAGTAGAKPAREVLTGLIARNDVATIRKHRLALKAMDPKLAKLYDAFMGMAGL
jgi:predicted short-subunit dehydrogenase-like oxidoreductase (DUF2520 family)